MIALIGEKEVWNGLAPLGVNVFEVETRAEIEQAIENIKQQNFFFILISDEIAKKIEDKIDLLYKDKNLKIVLLPSIAGDKKEFKEQLYYKRLQHITEKAMGVDILG